MCWIRTLVPSFLGSRDQPINVTRTTELDPYWASLAILVYSDVGDRRALVVQAPSAVTALTTTPCACRLGSRFDGRSCSRRAAVTLLRSLVVHGAHSPLGVKC